MPNYVPDITITDLERHRKFGGKFVCQGQLVTLIQLPNTMSHRFPFVGSWAQSERVYQWRSDGFPPPWESHTDENRLYAAKAVLSEKEVIADLTQKLQDMQNQRDDYRTALESILREFQGASCLGLNDVDNIFRTYTDLLD